MSGIILHHFDASPFAEKVRIALGMKNLSWNSVQIPMVMPKPDLTLLTGGYRKTPVLQIGADIYCDTQRIAAELEHRFPERTIFPGGDSALSFVLAAWSDVSLFQPGAGLSMGTNLDLPAEILADRFAFFNFLDAATLPAQIPAMFAQFRAGLQRLDDMLRDGRPWLLGDKQSWADAACYACVWMCRGNIQGAENLLQGLHRLAAWEQQLVQIGHGDCIQISAAQAHAIALESETVAESEIAALSWPQLSLGEEVSITPYDYGAVSVRGQLLRLTDTDVAIQRHNDQIGEVVVHFPRIGYRVEKI